LPGADPSTTAAMGHLRRTGNPHPEIRIARGRDRRPLFEVRGPPQHPPSTNFEKSWAPANYACLRRFPFEIPV
jgi:hypothetical protein